MEKRDLAILVGKGSIGGKEPSLFFSDTIFSVKSVDLIENGILECLENPVSAVVICVESEEEGLKAVQKLRARNFVISLEVLVVLTKGNDVRALYDAGANEVISLALEAELASKRMENFVRRLSLQRGMARVLHDLKSPLSVIALLVENGPQEDKLVTRLDKSTKKMVGILNQAEELLHGGR